MRTQSELKEMLISIRNNGYRIPENVEGFELALEMMHYIGVIDPELRDELIYEIFLKWTMNGVFTEDQMRQLSNICLDDKHLFFGIGENGTDSVFTRTFSALMIPLVLYMDQKHAFLSCTEVLNIKNKVFDYMRKEKDTRGYVEGKGWAHSTAHGSDALDDIAKSEFIGHDDLLDMLDIIKHKFSINTYTYINREDERAVTAIMSVLDRKQLGSEEFTNWIRSFGKVQKTGEPHLDQSMHANMKGLLRSLYFRLLPSSDTRLFTDAIIETLAII